MRPAWRLATNSLLARRNRSLLLVGAVALSAALIAVVSCAMASLTAAVESRLNETVGRSDIRVKPVGAGETMPASVLERVRGWEGVEIAVPSMQESSSWRFQRHQWSESPTGFVRERVTAVGTAILHGIDPALETRVRDVRMVEGRLPSAPGEVALDRPLVAHLNKESNRAGGAAGAGGPGPASVEDAAEAAKLNEEHRLKVGDTVEFVRLFRKNETFKVVGIVAEPPFGPRWRAFVTLETLQGLTGDRSRVGQVDLVLAKGVDAEALAAAHREEFGKGVIVQTTERITSGLENNVRSQDLGFVVATVMSFLAAAFIIMTGMSTGVTERQRELSVMRCIGATRGQLAWAQLMAGGLVGAAGAVVGVPLGLAIAALLIHLGREHVPNGLHVSVLGLGVAGAGAVVAGLAGAAFPAWKASRVSPLEGLGVRARPVPAGAVVVLAACGIGALAVQLTLMFGGDDSQFAFWSYATAGLPLMFIGYFLLSVPVLVLLNRAVEPVLRRVMGLHRHLLGRTVRATPYRYGFTAGAMMSGLALMVAIWTQGHAILNDWLGKLEFPDAFAVGLNLTEESRAKVEALPFVTGTVPITLHNVETQAFGVKALQTYKTTFIAFDPEPFFRLTRLNWVEPTDEAGQQRAMQRLREGGAVIVAREFKVAQGIGAGDTFTMKGADGREHPMEVVGVVTSPGLEIVSNFFSIGDNFTEQAIHAVFGSRKDLKEKLGSDAISMLQIGLSKDVSDEEAISTIRSQLMDAGILDAGSGRKIKADILKVIKGTLLISSGIAVFAMVIASFGVANIIVAGIQTRRFEFGVLRAVGGSRGLLVRLVLGEAVLIALAAGLLGTALGTQAVASAQHLDKLLFGLELSTRPPLLPVVAGWCAVFVVTLGAAAPAVFALSRARPRELLASR
ncbi:MAG TPA: ABC transporter permease [Phycisphaerales bacterium]|nr:ABC transporter permease [Phycisphaerales bacterium]